MRGPGSRPIEMVSSLDQVTLARGACGLRRRRRRDAEALSIASGGSTEGGVRKARPVAVPTKAGMMRSALAYVERYPSTVVSLTRVLKRKLDRYEHKTGESAPADARSWIEPIVKELVERGFVDDKRLAAAKTASLQRRGKSKRAVSAALRAKGVTGETIDAVLAETETTDAEAAWRLAKRRRLGPYREADARAENRQRDMGVLGRAGFSFEIARAVIQAEEPRDTQER